MNSKFDYDLLSAMMTNANMGWWEADLRPKATFARIYLPGCWDWMRMEPSALKIQQTYPERGTTAYYHTFLRQYPADTRDCISAQHSRGSNVDKKQDMPAENR